MNRIKELYYIITGQRTINGLNAQDMINELIYEALSDYRRISNDGLCRAAMIKYHRLMIKQLNEANKAGITRSEHRFLKHLIGGFKHEILD